MPSQELNDALRTLLKGRHASTQEEICIALEKQGYEINQSKVSRLLRKIGAVKILTALGQVAYSLPREPAPPALNTPLRDLILDILTNEVSIIIFTSPGSASIVARTLDYHQSSLGILGTIGGDDTILIIPKSIKETQKVAKNIRAFFLE